MSGALNFSIPKQYDEIYLIGLRIDPDKENYDFLTIIFSGDEDIPLNIDNYTIWFNEIYCLTETIKKFDSEIYQKIDLSEIAMVIDIAHTLWLLEGEYIDNSATIIDTINSILDLLKSSKIKIPDEPKKVLFKTADYFTFDTNIQTFFEDPNIQRRDVINIILWSIGAIFSKSKFLT